MRPTTPTPLNDAVRRLHPGYLAMVMATGILSTAALLLGLKAVSWLFLAIASLAYLLLAPLYIWRAFRFWPAFYNDLRSPQRAFGFFTFVAGSNVLAIRLAMAEELVVATVLWVVGTLAWLILTYAVPAVLMLREEKAPIGSAVSGAWLTWVVGTQSIAAAAATIGFYHPRWAPALAAVGVSFWSIGALLYLLLIGLIVQRLFFSAVQPGDLSPPYWISMGACAITVIAGARILVLPPELAVLQATRPVVEGVSFMFWAFGTWWIPTLVIWGLWRHLARRLPVTYDPSYWSLVFPLGMYAASSIAFGRATGLPFLVTIGAGEVWFGFLAWGLVFLGMVRPWARGWTAGGRAGIW